MRHSVRSLVLLAILAASPVLAQRASLPTAAVSPPLTVPTGTGSSGCSPYNPCAIAPPALGLATVPTAAEPPQPTGVTGEAAAEAAAAPAAPARGATAQAAQAQCPPGTVRMAAGRGPGGAQGGQAGRGQFAGRGPGGGAGGQFAGRAGAGRGGEGRQGGGQFAGRGGEGRGPAGQFAGRGQGSGQGRGQLAGGRQGLPPGCVPANFQGAGRGNPAAPAGR